MTRNHILVLCLLILTAGCTTGRSARSAGVNPVLQGGAGDVVVMVFASPDCPISNALAPEYQRLHSQIEEGGGRFYLVHARPDVTAQVAAKHASDYQLKMPIILDPDHDIVQAMNATVTPEAVVLVFEGPGIWRKVYQGQVNDLYASLGNRRDHPTQFWLRDAITASFAGEKVKVAYRKPIGCYIERNR